MKVASVEITGMRCENCVQSVSTTLRSLPGVAGCRVRLGHADVWFDSARIAVTDLLKAIRSGRGFEIAGFHVQSSESAYPPFDGNAPV